VFFNINGSGLGHLSTCLAYARRLRARVRPVFFSLAAAVEIIHDFGFEADYFVSPFWSRASNRAWNRELALRLGLLFERVRPEAIVFDGTWPYPGLLDATAAYGVKKKIWSNLTLYKKGTRKVPVRESLFDLVLRLGEIGSEFEVQRAERPGRRVLVPPVTLLRPDELLDRDAARAELGLAPEARYALFSLGPGNLQDVSSIGSGLIDEIRARGFDVAWVHAPISVKDVPLPDGVVPVAAYPIARYMRAFDVFVGAAGYNTCCEVLQARLPALFVPSALVADDQVARAARVATRLPAVVSGCETGDERRRAIDRLMTLVDSVPASRPEAVPELSGAEHACEEIEALLSG